MKVTLQQSFEYDIKKERQKIKKAFTGSRRKFHLDLLRAFEQWDIDKFIELWNNAPQNTRWDTTELEWAGGYSEIVNAYLSGIHHISCSRAHGVKTNKPKLIEIEK